jgi:hypothetical protein
MVKKSGDFKDIIEYLHLWYETYHKIITYFGTIAVSILFFTVTFLVKDFLSGAYSDKLKITDIINIKRSILLFGISLLFVFINLLSTYNWFVSGVDGAMRNSNVDLSVLGDQFKYRRHMGSMGFWGTISLISGWLAGIALFAGIVVYVIGVWSIMDIIFKLK